MAENRPGNGLWGWLGRQIGYVKKAVSADVAQQIVHREQHVQEARLPDQPNVTLRRTVIDEVIVDKKTINGSRKTEAGMQNSEGGSQ